MHRAAFILILSLVFFSLFPLTGRACLHGGIVLTGQEQINNFPIDYPGCTEIDGEIKIYGVETPPGDRITDLSPLGQVTSILGSLKIYGCMDLSTLEGLENLTSIGENLEIYHVGITDLGGLDALVSIGGMLWLEDNPFLASVSGAGSLASVGTNLAIGVNSLLADLAGFNSLSSIGGDLEIYKNASLTAPEGLSLITAIGGNLYINDNPVMTTLQGLESVQSISGGIDIGFNPDLVSLMALAGLTSLGGDLEIYCNDSLGSLAGLENLKSLQGDLNIACLDNLQNLKGLNSIKYIIGNITVQSNLNIQSFSGLNALETIGGQIKVWSNGSLKDFSGLENLEVTGGFLKVHDNPVLSSLKGLENLNHTYFQYIYLVDNDSLSECAVESICRFFYDPIGTVVIHGNKEGCNSNLEISQRCEGLFPDPLPVPGDYLLYPNPTDDRVYLVTGEGRSITNLQVFNGVGQRILRVDEPDPELDVSRLATGVYTLRFEIDGQGFTTRLVVR